MSEKEKNEAEYLKLEKIRTLAGVMSAGKDVYFKEMEDKDKLINLAYKKLIDTLNDL